MAEPAGQTAPESWTPVEQRMWRAFRAGRTCDLRSGRPEEDDPLTNPEWPANRTVRAQAVAELLLDPPPATPGRVAALKLTGVRISGRLSLAGGTVTPYVQLNGCRFDEQVLLQECRAGSSGEHPKHFATLYLHDVLHLFAS